MRPLRTRSRAGSLRRAAVGCAGVCLLSVLLAGPGLTAAVAGAAAGTASPVPVPPGPVPPGIVPPGPGPPDGLLITARESASSPVVSWSLTCDPPGGTHPDPALACQALSSTPDPFAPVPAGVMCSMIYYGPQTATITGYWQGQPVSAQFSRVNGCQEQRWETIAPVLVVPVLPVPANPGGPLRPGPHG